MAVLFLIKIVMILNTTSKFDQISKTFNFLQSFHSFYPVYSIKSRPLLRTEHERVKAEFRAESSYNSAEDLAPPCVSPCDKWFLKSHLTLYRFRMDEWMYYLKFLLSPSRRRKKWNRKRRRLFRLIPSADTRCVYRKRVG